VLGRGFDSFEFSGQWGGVVQCFSFEFYSAKILLSKSTEAAYDCCGTATLQGGKPTLYSILSEVDAVHFY
jgi:hypothetical protein